MNAPKTPPSDDEIDRLLGSRFKDTTPEFEARWRDLRRELRHAPPARQGMTSRTMAWFGLAAAGLSLTAVLLVMRTGQPTPPPVPQPLKPSPVLAQLFEMDAVLAPARPLLDPENRDVLLHLPVHSALPPST